MPYIIPIATNDVMEVRLVGVLHGQQTILTFRYVMTRASGTGDIDMEPLATGFVTTLWTPLRGIMSAEYTGATIYIQKIAPVRLVAFEHIPEETTGETAGQSCPSYVSYVFRRKLLLAGRRYQGRVFVPAVPTANEENSRVPAGILTGPAVENIKEGMLDVIEIEPGVDAAPCLVVPDGDGYANRGRLNTIELDPVLRCQRRREVGRGI